MRARLFFVVCLTGCGLTLDLDEPIDASARDIPGRDAGDDLRDSGVDAGGPDAALPDAALPDGGPVETGDAGSDAPLEECDSSCDEDETCLLGECWDLCGGEVCFAGQVCDEGTCVLECDSSMCALGHSCGRDGRCVCDEGDCGSSERCGADGTCQEVRCKRNAECVDLAGSGCTDYVCVAGTCVSMLGFDPVCEYCDPRTGEVHFFDRDGDGFEECASGICGGPDICDCDDENPFVNPASVDALGVDRNCDGIFDPLVPLFCVHDEDEDSAPVISPAVDRDCGDGLLLTAREVVIASRTLPRLDCNDDNIQVFPLQVMYMPTAIDGIEVCTPARGECFDYNCDGRHERQHPAFVQCDGATSEADCRALVGWVRIPGGPGVVPACGERGQLAECTWTSTGCSLDLDVEAYQHCR